MKKILIVAALLLSGCGNYDISFTDKSNTQAQIEKILREMHDCNSIGKGHHLHMWEGIRRGSPITLEYTVSCVAYEP